MTMMDPGVPPPPPVVPPPPPPAPPAMPPFNPGMLLLGLVLTLPIGLFANIIFVLMGSSTNSKVLAALMGIVPGGICVLLSLVAKRNRGLAAGLLIGGCIVALIGGACGVAITPFKLD